MFVTSDRVGTRENIVPELLRYVRFTSKDTELLQALHPKAAPHFEGIAIQFYDRIREHESVYEVFMGEE